MNLFVDEAQAEFHNDMFQVYGKVVKAYHPQMCLGFTYEPYKEQVSTGRRGGPPTGTALQETEEETV